MKHGPIALLDESTPVVVVATDSPVLEKVLSNVSEVRARGADVIAVATEGSVDAAAAADQTLFVPRTDWVLQPILAILPLQLLAYYIARLERPQRRPAAKPRQDRHGRVAGGATDARPAALRRRHRPDRGRAPRARSAAPPAPGRAAVPAGRAGLRGRPAQARACTWRHASPPRRPRSRRCARGRSRCATSRSRGVATRLRACACTAPRPRVAGRRRVELDVSLTHTRSMAAAVVQARAASGRD